MNSRLLSILEADLEIKEEPSLLGFSSIPWEEITQKIRENWNLSDLSLQAKNIQSLPYSKLLSGFSENFYLVSFHFTPLLGEIFWVMDHQDLALLCGKFLLKDSVEKTLSSEALQESFYHFLLAEVLFLTTRHDFFQNFSPKIVSRTHLPEETCLGIDIAIQSDTSSFWGRVLVSPEFHKSWNHYLEEKFPKELVSKSLQEKEIPLFLSLSEIVLSEEEWESVKMGDFLLIEGSSYDSSFHSGKGCMYYLSHPLFEVEFAEKEAQILHPVESPSPKKDRLTLAVVLNQIKLPLHKILTLKKGDMLSFSDSPSSVQLFMQGEKKAEGELFYLGNQLGVRVTKLAK